MYRYLGAEQVDSPFTYCNAIANTTLDDNDVDEHQTERFANGTWRAWFPSGGWVMKATTEKEAKFAAATEWYRRLRLPDEVARRYATMGRHLKDPAPGVEFFPYEELPESVRQRIEQHERHPGELGEG